MNYSPKGGHLQKAKLLQQEISKKPLTALTVSQLLLLV